MPKKNTSRRHTEPLRFARSQLRDVLWEGETVAATLFVGTKKGVQPRNRKGFCAKQPAVFRQKDLDETVQGIRYGLLKDRGMSKEAAKAALGGSRVAQKGWYKGVPESSAAYTIFFDPSVKGEETPAQFKSSMQRLAEFVGGALCQDEVIVQITSPSGNRSMGVRDDDDDRRTAIRMTSALRRRR
jgi:hypothetical protein